MPRTGIVAGNNYRIVARTNKAVQAMSGLALRLGQWFPTFAQRKGTLSIGRGVMAKQHHSGHAGAPQKGLFILLGGSGGHAEGAISSRGSPAAQNSSLL